MSLSEAIKKPAESTSVNYHVFEFDIYSTHSNGCTERHRNLSSASKWTSAKPRSWLTLALGRACVCMWPLITYDMLKSDI